MFRLRKPLQISAIGRISASAGRHPGGRRIWRGSAGHSRGDGVGAGGQQLEGQADLEEEWCFRGILPNHWISVKKLGHFKDCVQNFVTVL